MNPDNSVIIEKVEKKEKKVKVPKEKKEKVPKIPKVKEPKGPVGRPKIVRECNIVYTIECKDKAKDTKIYVGSTINTLNQRITEHKQCAQNPAKSTSNELYINMRTIGIENYEFKKVKQFATISKVDLRNEEDKVKAEFIEKGVKVYNMRQAHDTEGQAKNITKWRKEHANRFFCDCCNYGCACEIEYNKHLGAKIHAKRYVLSLGEEFISLCNNYDEQTENEKECQVKYYKYISGWKKNEELKEQCVQIGDNAGYLKLMKAFTFNPFLERQITFDDPMILMSCADLKHAPKSLLKLYYSAKDLSKLIDNSYQVLKDN